MTNVHETPDISAAVERVREGLREHEAEYGVDPEALAALDTLGAHIQQFEWNQAEAMALVMSHEAHIEQIKRERDEALHAEDVAERYREALEVALREIAELIPEYEGGAKIATGIARRALNEEKA